MAKNYQITDVLANKKPYTSVYAAYNKNKELCTVKINDLESLDDSQAILSEVSRTKHIRHTNILSLIECFVDDSQIWCVYPFMFYGSCKDILDCISSLNLSEEDKIFANLQNATNIDRADEQRRLCFNEQSLQPITKALLSALDYLHSKYIIHRCVCPENIYVSQTGHVFLSGFKYSVSLIEQGELVKKLHDYPSDLNDYLNYLSPEFLQQNLIGYNTKTDIYSLGITLCELANGVNPFIGCDKAQMLLEKLSGFDVALWDRSILNSESNINIIESVCAVENPKVIASIERRYFSDKFRNFVDLCVQRQSDSRPTAAQLSQHIYLKKMKLNNVCSTLQMSVMCDGLVEIKKKILLQEQLDDHANLNGYSVSGGGGSGGGADGNTTTTTNNNNNNNNNHSTNNQATITTTTTSSNINPDPDDYDEVPVESIQNSLWNFDN